MEPWICYHIRSMTNLLKYYIYTIQEQNRTEQSYKPLHFIHFVLLNTEIRYEKILKNTSMINQAEIFTFCYQVKLQTYKYNQPPDYIILLKRFIMFVLNFVKTHFKRVSYLNEWNKYWQRLAWLILLFIHIKWCYQVDNLNKWIIQKTVSSIPCRTELIFISIDIYLCSITFLNLRWRI